MNSYGKCRITTAGTLAVIIFIAVTPPSILAEDWPQLGNNPQRWNYSAEKIEPPFRLKWYVNLQDLDFDYRIYPGIQVVTGGGKVYIGTKNGYLFALDGADGNTAWRYTAGAPVMGEAGYANGRVFVAAMDATVHGVDVETGKNVWIFSSGRRYGFSTGVLLVDGKVFLGDRGGMFYAIAQADGAKIWQYDTGSQILQAAAYNEGRVYFGSEDGYIYALNAKTGALIWRGGPLWIHTFCGSWPVVFDGKLILRYHTTHKVVVSKPVAYEKNDWHKSLVVLDEKTGEETLFLPHITTGMGGPTKPPAITGDGKLVVPCSFVGKGKTRGLVLQDLNDPQQVGRLLDHDKLNRPIEYPFRGGQRTPGFGSHQENFSNSVIGDVVAKIHYHGFAWGDPSTQMGFYHLKQRRWYNPGKGRTGFAEPVGGDREHNTQGGTSAPAIGAMGCIYHQHWNTVCCWEPAKR